MKIRKLRRKKFYNIGPRSDWLIWSRDILDSYDREHYRDPKYYFILD